MTHPDSVRNSICEILVQLGASKEATMDESLLMRDGLYCGHRFRRDGLQAIWFVEENQVKVFGRDGTLIDSLASAEIAARMNCREEHRFAA